MSEELTKTKLLPIQGKDMDSIMQNLETGVAELFTSERYQDYLKTMSKFHNYSFNNTLLIAMQRPDATLVTGYRNWQSMGRQVKKRGEGNYHYRTGADQKEKGAGSIGSGSETGDRSGWKTKDGRGGGHTSLFQGDYSI
ncbi:MAG: ArdC family protein [Coprococcus sp.]